MLQYHLTLKENSTSIRILEKGIKRILYLDSLKNLAKGDDLAPLTFLTKLHIRASNTRNLDTLSFQEIDLPPENIIEALKLLVQTGRLLYQNTPLKLEQEEPLEIYFHGEKHSEKACTIHGAVEAKEGEIQLSDLGKIFQGWVLSKGSIYWLETKLPWRWVQLFLQGPVLLEGVQKKRFLEEDPIVFWKEGEKKRVLEVFPELRLTDPTGCFGNLWMDYPEVGTISFDDPNPAVGGLTRLKKNEMGWEKDLVESGFLKKIVGTSHYFCAGDKVRETLLFLLDIGWKIIDFEGRAIIRQTESRLDICEKEGVISVRGDLTFGEKSAPLKKGLEVQNRGGLWLSLDSTTIGLIDGKKGVALEGEWVSDSLQIKRGSIGSLLPLVEGDGVKWEESLKAVVLGLKKGASLEDSPPSQRFKGKLIPYQQKGVDFLSFLYRWGFSALLADEMGLGKTVQVLAFFSRLGTNLPSLIVAPSSLLYQWKMEIQRFLPDLIVSLHTGPDRTTDPADFRKVDCVITSYAILRLDEELFSKTEFEVVVLDESNAIKTAKTQTAKAAYKLNGRFKIALTGTPIENRREELWSQFKFLMPDLFSQKKEFQVAGFESIRKKITPFIIRRKKSEVEIELPEKIEEISWVEMHPEQEALYNSYLEGVRSGLLKKVEVEGAASHRMEMLETILRLRQISCDPRLIGSEIVGSKIELLLDDLEDKKVLIYSQFTSMLKLIGAELNKMGKEFLYLDGTLSPEKRSDLVMRFQKDEEKIPFLLSLKAGGVGLNLTAADYVLLFDPWWNEAVENQAIDRAHRIGQKKRVIVKRYLSPGSIEEKMLRLKEEKKGAAEQLLEGSGSSWTEGDWLRLLT